jgi:serine protease
VKKLLLSVAGLSLFLSACSSSNPTGSSQADTTATTTPSITNQAPIEAGGVIVTLNEGMDIQSLSSELVGLSLSSVTPLGDGNIYILHLSRKEFSNQSESDLKSLSVSETWDAVARLKASSKVKSVMPNYLMTIQSENPSDAYFGEQWDMKQIKMLDAWKISKGSSNTVIAVLDTGVAYGHTDLAANLLPGRNFVSGTRNAQDPGDGADCGKGYGYQKSIFHGTHVAGTIAAVSDNYVGVAGINWNSKVLPVRVVTQCGGTTENVMLGLLWAAGALPGPYANPNPAKVINMSLGLYWEGHTCQNDFGPLNDIFTFLASKNITVVVAAGNDNRDAKNFTPASCGNVITVAATRKNWKKASYSNFGSNVDLSGPGGEWVCEGQNSTGCTRYTPGELILSTSASFANDPARTGFNTNDYSFLAGTSMATPHVAGVVGLMYSLKPNITPAQVQSILRNTSIAFNSDSGCYAPTSCGAGMLNAQKALEATKRLP